MHAVQQKLLALLLAAAMACTFMIPAFAAGTEPAPQAPAYTYEALDKTVMKNTAKASSEETSDKAAGWNDDPAAWAFDDDTAKCWHTSYTPGNTAETPVTLEWDLMAEGAAVQVGRLVYQTKTPSQDNGKWKTIEILATVDGQPVSVFKGNVNRDASGRAEIDFGPVNATHLKVVITETDGDHSNGGNNDNKFAAAGEITVYKAVAQPVEPEPEPEPEQPAGHAALDKAAMMASAKASSEEPAEGGNPYGDGPAAWAFDNDISKPWHSQYTGSEIKGTHWIEWKLGAEGETFEVSKVHYDMKNNAASGNGLWQKVTVEAFLAGKQVFTKEFDVTSGNFDLVLGENVLADSMKITVTQSVNQMSCAGEITVYGVKKDVAPQPPQPDNSVAVVVTADGTETKFDTVAAAVAAAKAGETVRLTKDSTTAKLTLDKQLTLDLNGFTLTAAAGELVHVLPTGIVKIVDQSSGESRGTLVGLSSAEAVDDPAAMTVANQGQLVLDGVDVIGVKAKRAASGLNVTAVFVDENASLEITGDASVTGVYAAEAVTDFAAVTILNYGTTTLKGNAVVKGVHAASVTTEVLDGFDFGADVIATSGVLNVQQAARVIGAEGAADTADIRAITAAGAVNLTGGTITTAGKSGAVVLTGANLVLAADENGVVPVIENTRGPAVVFAPDYENGREITAGILTVPAVSGQFTDLNAAVAAGFTTETGNRTEAGWTPAAEGACVKVIQGEKPQPKPFTWNGANLSLSGEIGVNFYGTFSPELVENGVVVITVPDHPEVKLPIKDAAVEETFGRKFSASVAVRQMTEEIQIRVMKGEEQIGRVVTYTVYDNAKALLESKRAEVSAQAKDLARAMLFHGAEMQKYKGHRIDKLATEGVDVTTLAERAAAVTAESLAEYAPHVTGKAPAGLALYGTSLSLEDETALKYYFTKQDGFAAAGYQVELAGQRLPLTEEDGYFVAKLDNISASHLDEMVDLAVTDGKDTLTIHYGPLSYARESIRGNKESKAVAQSLVIYNQAANAYAASVNN